MTDEFIIGDYRAVISSEEPMEKGLPSKLFSVDWFYKDELIQGSSGYEDYKFARHEAQMLLKHYAEKGSN